MRLHRNDNLFLAAAQEIFLESNLLEQNCRTTPWRKMKSISSATYSFPNFGMRSSLTRLLKCHTDNCLNWQGWEIKAASVKLAECEATILNLGNQLKTLTSPKEASNLNKMLFTPSKNNKKLNQRFSLLDRMLSDDSTKMEDLKPSQAKELISIAETQRQPPSRTNSSSAFYASSAQLASSEGDLGLKHEASKSSKAGALVVVPSKKRGKGIGFVRRLLLWKKRGSNKRTPFSFVT